MKKATSPTVTEARIALFNDPANTFTPSQLADITDGFWINHYAMKLAQFAKRCQDKTPGSSGHKRRALRMVKRALKVTGVCDGDQK